MSHKYKLLLLVVVIVITYIGYEFYRSSAVLTSEKSNLSQATPVPTQEKWIQFKSDYIHLLFSYPEIWEASEHQSGYYVELITNIPSTDKGDQFYSVFVNNDIGTITVNSYPQQGLNIDKVLDYMNKIKSSAKTI